MAQYISQEYHIVRYPDSDGDIYIYNAQSGIYELDKTGRKLRKIIRSLDVLKDNSVKKLEITLLICVMLEVKLIKNMSLLKTV